MARLTRDEFNTKYSEKIIDNDDLLIELMEDISDSITNDESEELQNLRLQLEAKKEEYDALKEKYKARFLNAVESDEKEVDEKPAELSEEEVIDIKEI